LNKINRLTIRSILVLHQNLDELKGQIEARFPEISVHYAESSDEVESALEAAQPDAIFAINGASMSSSAQRMAGLYPTVKWFHVGGSGIDQLLPWSNDNAIVSNCTGVLARYLAEMLMAGMLALNNHFPAYYQQQQNKAWVQHQFKPLCDQTLLVVGLGAIGGYVADYAKAMGMRVIATRRSDTPHRSVDKLYPAHALANIISQADVVSLHLRLDDQTRHIINTEIIAAMKPGVNLINTSRGGVVDQNALIEALNSGQIGGAYLDVFEVEPLPKDSPLWVRNNVIVTPHTADNVFSYETKYMNHFCDNIARWQSGEPLKNQISF
jgi:phosphoglycerate dehydrogenase-like enzyme